MYNFLEIPKIGAYWIGIPISLTGLAGLFASRTPTSILPAIMTIVLGVLSLGMGSIGVIIDSIGSSAVNSLLVCLNHEGNLYGDTTASDAIILLALSDYMSHDLTCSPRNTDILFHYEGTTNGNVILTTYNTLLKMNVALDVASLCSVAVIIIVACMVSCCPTKLRKLSETAFQPTFHKSSQNQLEIEEIQVKSDDK